MNKLLRFSNIQQITGGQWLMPPPDFDVEVRAGAFDTRSLNQAEIFFAWQGDHSDGHDYLQQLEGSGIKLAIVEKEVPPLHDIAILKVHDSLEALHKLAKYLALHFKGKIVNITGSSGKTTAKTWLSHLLKDHFRVLNNPGSFNNHIGCPITISSLNPDHNLMILEMGSSGLGELEILSAIAPADITLLLNVGHAHLGKFKTLENTYRAKTEIFAHQRHNAVSILPYGDQRLTPYWPVGQVQTFGKDSSEYSYQTVSIDPEKKMQRIRFQTPFGEKTVNVGQLGNYVGDLLSALLAVCFNLGLSWQDIHTRLQSLPQEKGRSTFLNGIKGVLLLDDTYNANPESMVNMLETICSLQMDQYIGVVGNLAELDTDLSESAEHILSNLPDKLTTLFLSGETGEILTPLIQSRKPQLKTVYASSVVEIIEQLQPMLNPRTVIGIKGSRSSHMERVIHGLTGTPFSCILKTCGRLNSCDVCDLFNISAE
jgi:UDP-N-acetylmuramoyl-tripeptide--D-alanyl-D-alanine ligase